MREKLRLHICNNGLVPELERLDRSEFCVDWEQRDAIEDTLAALDGGAPERFEVTDDLVDRSFASMRGMIGGINEHAVSRVGLELCIADRCEMRSCLAD